MKKIEYLDICKKCKATCCRLGGTNLTKEEVDKILDKGYENNFKEVKPGIFELISNQDGSCPYLDEDFSCKIQDVKPIICTCWPIFPEYDDGKINHELINCPLVKTMSKEDIDRCKKESETVRLDIAECSADESMTPIHQRDMIKKRYEDIEKDDI